MIIATEVQRDEYGYWTHPDYLEFCDGRECIPSEEFDKWMQSQGIECSVEYRDEEMADPDMDGGNLSSWQPEQPNGEGWFIGSIHDSEDGAVCIWLRAKPAEAGK